jgi:hypothetical protein
MYRKIPEKKIQFFFFLEIINYSIKSKSTKTTKYQTSYFKTLQLGALNLPDPLSQTIKTLRQAKPMIQYYQ